MSSHCCHCYQPSIENWTKKCYFKSKVFCMVLWRPYHPFLYGLMVNKQTRLKDRKKHIQYYIIDPSCGWNTWTFSTKMLKMNVLLVVKIFFVALLLVQYTFHINVALAVLEGVIPVLDVAAHSLQVHVWGGHGDGQLSPEDQGWWSQSHWCSGPHLLSSEPERVNI